jgi:hypothetical protein
VEGHVTFNVQTLLGKRDEEYSLLARQLIGLSSEAGCSKCVTSSAHLAPGTRCPLASEELCAPGRAELSRAVQAALRERGHACARRF